MAYMVCLNQCPLLRSYVSTGGARSFDVSKQVIGQMFVHGVNVLISGLVAHLSSGNACVLYFLNILIDTTLGKSSGFAYDMHVTERSE